MKIADDPEVRVEKQALIFYVGPGLEAEIGCRREIAEDRSLRSEANRKGTDV